MSANQSQETQAGGAGNSRIKHWGPEPKGEQEPGNTRATGAQTPEAPFELADQIPDPGTFPIASLPPVIRKFALGLAEYHALPPEIVGWACLATLGAAMGKMVETEATPREGQRTCGNVWALLAAPTGVGKGFLKYVVSEIETVENQHREAWKRERSKIEAKLKIKETDLGELKAKLKRPQDGFNRGALEHDIHGLVEQIDGLKDQLRFSPRLLFQSASTAALSRTIAVCNESTFFVASSEGRKILSVWMGAHSQKSQTDADLIVSGKTRDRFQVDTVQEGREELVIEDPLGAICVLAQPDYLREFLADRNQREQGTIGRFNAILTFNLPRNRSGIGQVPFPREAAEKFGSLVYDLTEARLGGFEKQSGRRFDAWGKAFALPGNQSPKPLLIPCDAEGKAVLAGFGEFVNRLVDDGTLADFHAETPRATELAINVAVVLAVAECPEHPRITKALAEVAVQIQHHALFSLLHSLARGKEALLKPGAAKLEAILKECEGEAPLRELARNGYWKKVVEIEEIVNKCPGIFKIERRTPDGPGRPSVIVRLK